MVALSMISNKAAKVLREIEQQAQQDGIPIVGPAKGELLSKVVAEKSPRFAVEVGTAVGYSAIIIASVLSKQGRLVTIEYSPALARQARGNLERAGLAKVVSVVTGDALAVLPRVEHPIVFLFLDAAKEEYLEYLKTVEDRLQKGAVVVADNAKIFAADMADYLDYVRHSGRYRSEFHDLGFDGMEVSVKLR